MTVSRPEIAHDFAAVPRIASPNDLPARAAILVVEDDWSIRRFVCSILKGTTEAIVIEAADPDSALSKAKDLAYPIDLLITDIDLRAAKTGIDLACEIARRYPAAQIMLMSGADCPQSAIPTPWRFLAKPFPVPVFVDCVCALCGLARPA